MGVHLRSEHYDNIRGNGLVMRASMVYAIGQVDELHKAREKSHDAQNQHQSQEPPDHATIVSRRLQEGQVA
jgi:hypothetical protein